MNRIPEPARRPDQTPVVLVALAAIRNMIDDLHGFLVAWHHPRAGQEEQHRRAGAEALSAVDSLLSELHGIRGGLVREIVASELPGSGDVR